MFRIGFIFWLGAAMVCAAMGRAADEEPSEAATRQFASAVALQNRGVFELAAEEWAKFIDENPKDPRRDQAFHFLGVCYLKSNRFDLAAQSFKIVLDTYPKSMAAETSLFYLGMTEYAEAQSGKKSQYAKAAATFGSYLTKYPTGKSAPEALFYLAESQYAQGKKADAAKTYGQLIGQYPSHARTAEALYAQGVAEQELGQNETAAKIFDVFLDRFATHALAAEVIMRRGEADFALGRFDQAAKRFATAAGKKGYAMADAAIMRQAASLAQQNRHAEAAALYAQLPTRFPKSDHAAAALLAGGKCLYAAARFGEARSTLARLPADAKEAAEAAHWIARCWLKEKKPQEAAAVAAKALEKKPSGPTAVQLLMDQADAAYEIPERRAESVALFQKLADEHAKDPAAAQARYMAGFAAMESGRFDEAIKQCEAFCNQYSEHDLMPEVWFLAAESYLQLNQPAKAREWLDRLIAKYPKRSDADLWRVRRALTFYLEKNYKDTIAAIEPILGDLRAPELIAEAQFLLGGSRLETGKFDAAVAAFEASTSASLAWRQAEDALMLLASAYRRQGRLDKACETLERLVAKFPKGRLLDRALFQLGEYRYAAGQNDLAAKAYEDLLRREPAASAAADGLFGLMWARLAEKNFAAAEDAASRLIDKEPSGKLAARARFGCGTARQQLKKFQPAIEDLSAAIKSGLPQAERSDARYVIALCQVGLKDFGEAESTLRQLLREDLKYAHRDKVFYELAWTLKSLGKETDAAEAFLWLAEGCPDSPLAAEGFYHAGDAAFDAGNFVKAAGRFLSAMEKAGTSPLGEKAAHKLGWALYRNNDFEAARAAFAKQKADWPQGPMAADAAFMEAECLFKLGKFEEAINVYQTVKNPTGKDFDVFTLLHAGQAASQIQQWDRSVRLLSAAARRFPKSPYTPEILYEQGWAEQNRGRLDEAISLYEQVLKDSNGEAAAKAQFMIGEIQFQRKQYAEALKSFFKVAYGFGSPKLQADAVYESARCLELLDRKPQAIKQYQELLEKHPASDKVPAARERIETLKKATS